MVAQGHRVIRRSVYLLLLISISSSAYGDENLSSDSHDLFGVSIKEPRTAVGFTTSNCAKCHNTPSNDSKDELPPDVSGGENDGWILGNELRTWLVDDLHYQAFAVLSNEKSKQIGKLLGIEEPHRSRQCLTCHSSVPSDQMNGKDDRVEDDTQKDPRYTIGVSCEACHGPAGAGKNGEKGWDTIHAIDPSWRTMSAMERFEKFGYWDVHSTRSQTRICLSCHVGNVAQQKIITHEMYAAGHPPLPSFELSQFINQLPRHWRRFDEKSKALRDDFNNRRRKLNPPGEIITDISSTEFPITKMTMIAGVVTLEESARLSADLMSRSEASRQWPELANYSCFGCHHELQRDSWRKTPRLTTVAGRPSLHEWPFALSRIVAMNFENQGDEFQFKRETDQVVAALNSRPYGDREDLKTATMALAKRMETQSRNLASMTVDREKAVRFLRLIADIASKENVDYDTARQLVWAYERTLSEIDNRSTRNAKQSGSSKNEPPNTSLCDNQIFKEFEDSLVLCLRGNRSEGKGVELKRDEKLFVHKMKDVILTTALSKIASYQPKAIQDQFKRQKEHELKTIDSER